MAKPVRKPAKKTPATAVPTNDRASVAASKSAATTAAPPFSKQARVLEMLRTAAGATIAGMMQETGWQQHSVRGFLAGVVRKKLGLRLESKKVDGEHIYRIVSGTKTKLQAASKKRRV
jgi:hypothetical protein